MKKFINLSIAIIFVLTLNGFTNAQQNPVVPQVPKEVKKPIPPIDKAMDSAKAGEQDYEVPMIKKENLKEGKTTLKAEIEELNAEALLEKNKDGTTQLNISMSNINKIAKDKIFFVWIATDTGKYRKIGEVVHSEESKNTELKGKVLLESFGLFITVEDGKVDKPTSKTYAAFKQDSAE